MQTYLFSYRHGGKTWGFDIQAPSLEDAKARLSQMALARYEGILKASFSVPDVPARGLMNLTRRLAGFLRRS